MKELLTDNKKFLNKNYSANRSFYKKNARGESFEELAVFEVVDGIYSDEIISEFGHNLLINYMNDVKANYEGLLSNSELKAKTLQYINEFESHNYSLDSGEGQLIGTTLAISIASMEWWEENPDAYPETETFLAPWAALDIVGGVFSGAASAGIQYGVNGSVNWEIVGWSSLAGAVSSSTGVVGKVAKLLAK